MNQYGISAGLEQWKAKLCAGCPYFVRATQYMKPRKFGLYYSEKLYPSVSQSCGAVLALNYVTSFYLFISVIH